MSCNPLNPNYKLQTVTFVPPPVPRFIRDNIDNSDIDGAQPRKTKEIVPRDSFNVGDIKGTKSKGQYFYRKFLHD